MFVSLVSLRGRRGAIAVDVVEAALAADDPGTGNIIFATLVDDPASVGETVDAYLGEIMLEAASAADAPDASIPQTYAADVAEAVTAGDTTDASAAVSYVTWDPATVTAVTLSGGNLVATNTGTTGRQGAKTAISAEKATGKYYFEVTLTTLPDTTANDRAVGIGTFASTYAGMGGSLATIGVMFFPFKASNNVAANGAAVGTVTDYGATGSVIGIAADLDNRKLWFKNGADWNSNPAHNPATGAGGFVIPSGAMVPYIVFGGSFGVAGNVFTANFGASAFSRTVPSGFTAGWPG